MRYRRQQLGELMEFRLEDDRLEVIVKKRWGNREHHRFAKSAFSNSAGWSRHTDRLIASSIQLVFLVAFIGVILLHVCLERSGWTLWSGVGVSILGMIFGGLLSPKQRFFILYSSGGNPVVGIPEKRGKQGRAEFDQFVRALQDWLGIESEHLD